MRAWRAIGRAVCRGACLLCLGACLCLPAAWAGAQREEALSDAVRTALRAALLQQGPPELPTEDAAQQQAFARWLAQAQPRLAQQLRQRTQAARPAGARTEALPQAEAPITHELATPQLQREFLQTVWYESRRAGLEPALVLGLIQVESGFRKFAISSAGARGYMQVMPFWSRQLADGDASALFHMQANLRYGCVILRHYLQLENGDLTLALGRYNGSRGQTVYPDAVLAARRQWPSV